MANIRSVNGMVALFVMAAEIMIEHFLSTSHILFHHVLVHLPTKLDKNNLTLGAILIKYLEVSGLQQNQQIFNCWLCHSWIVRPNNTCNFCWTLVSMSENRNATKTYFALLQRDQVIQWASEFRLLTGHNPTSLWKSVLMRNFLDKDACGHIYKDIISTADWIRRFHSEC